MFEQIVSIVDEMRQRASYLVGASMPERSDTPTNTLEYFTVVNSFAELEVLHDRLGLELEAGRKRLLAIVQTDFVSPNDLERLHR